MGKYISIFIYTLFIWNYNQVTVGQLENDFQVMDEWTSNLISNEIDDNGSGEDLVPFPAGGETFDDSFSDHVGNSDYEEHKANNESEIEEESKLNSTGNYQEMNTTENLQTLDSKNEDENSNTTATDTENVYIMESWFEFGESNNQDEEEEKENTNDVNGEIQPQNGDQFGEELHSAGFGMGIFKEMSELSSDIRDSVVELPKNIRNSVAEIPDHVRNSVSELPNTIRNSVDGVWNGIKAVPKKVLNIPKHLPSFLNRSPEVTTQTSTSRRKTGFFGFGK